MISVDDPNATESSKRNIEWRVEEIIERSLRNKRVVKKLLGIYQTETELDKAVDPQRICETQHWKDESSAVEC